MVPRIVFLYLLATAPAMAERFDVVLAGRVMGQVDYVSGRIESRLDNTPLGVGDGTYEARTTASGGLREYEGVEISGRETRRIRIRLDGGDVEEVTIDPGSEATDLSRPDNVPDGVLDPVTAFGRIVEATDCPAPFRLYDGRRAISVEAAGRTLAADGLVCEMEYRVIAGPGHLSPFGFRTVAMVASYGIAEGRLTGLADLAVSAGPFTVHFAR